MTPGEPAVGVEAQVGKNNTKQAVANQETVDASGNQGQLSANKAQASTGNVQAENFSIEQAPVWLVLLVALGWMLPGPGVMWRGAVNFVAMLLGRKPLYNKPT